MSQRGEKGSGRMEQACVLCRQAEADPTICGRKLEKLGLCAHEFCLRFADNLCRQQDWDVGLSGFLPEDVRRAVDRAAQKGCCVCGERGATITCQEVDCHQSFHLPCSRKGRCVTQFYFSFRSFCSEHSPRQSLDAAPEGTRCLICLEEVEGRDFYNTVGCPACKHAWFHRECIQGQAMWDGMFRLRCPHCRDRDSFYPEMWNVGIRVPFRGASRGGRANEAVRERRGRCDTSQCLCPGGRDFSEAEGPWQLLLCSSCATEGTHRRCSSLSSSVTSWECSGCAGTASSASFERAGPSSSSRVSPAASSSSPAPQGSSPSSPTGPRRLRGRARAERQATAPYHRPLTRRHAESGTPGQAVLELSPHSPAPDTSPPSTTSLPPSGESCSSTGCQSSSHDSSPGPVRRRGGSRSRRRAQNPYSRRGRRRRS